MPNKEFHLSFFSIKNLTKITIFYFKLSRFLLERTMCTLRLNSRWSKWVILVLVSCVVHINPSKIWGYQTVHSGQIRLGYQIDIWYNEIRQIWCNMDYIKFPNFTRKSQQNKNLKNVFQKNHFNLQQIVTLYFYLKF